MPTPDETEGIDAIFAKAREITDPAQRAAYLNQACAEDKALRTEIESLLAADRGAADFMKLETLALTERCAGEPDSERKNKAT